MRIFLILRKFDSIINLIREIFKIQNTNSTFLVKIISKLLGFIKYEKSLYSKLTELCQEIIVNCELKSNLSMKNKIQTRLCQLHLINGNYKSGLELASKTLLDYKKFDDNLGLIEIQLIESQIHFETNGIAKCKVTIKYNCRLR